MDNRSGAAKGQKSALIIGALANASFAQLAMLCYIKEC